MGLIHPTEILHQVFALRPAAGEVLVLPGAGRAALPGLVEREHHPAEAAHVTGWLRERFGVDAVLLRCLDNPDAEAPDARRRLYLLEAIGSSDPVGGARWLPFSSVDQLEWADGAQGQAVERWIASWRDGQPPADGRGWTVPGWWSEALAWIDEQLARLGLGPRTAVAQVRAWEFSAVLEVSTRSGSLFMKALPTSLARETRLTAHLAGKHPRVVPEVVAVDERRRWMMMRGCAGRPLSRSKELRVWQEAVQAYADIQIDSTGEIERLERLGLKRHRPDELQREVEALLGDERALRIDRQDGLTGEDMERLRREVPVIGQMAAELAASAIPLALEHGDLWTSNMLAGPQDCAIIDWTDAYLGHPFLSMVPLMMGTTIEDALEDVPAARAHIRGAYLEAWSEHGSRDELGRAFDLAQRLGRFHYAALFWRSSLPRLDGNWELGEVIPYFLDHTLDAV